MARTKGSGGRVVTVRNAGEPFAVPNSKLLNIRRLTSSLITTDTLEKIQFTSFVYVAASYNLSAQNTRPTSNVERRLIDWQRASSQLIKEVRAEGKLFAKNDNRAIGKLVRPLRRAMKAGQNFIAELPAEEKRWRLIKKNIWLLWVAELNDILSLSLPVSFRGEQRTKVREIVDIIECLQNSMPAHAVSYKTKESIQKKLGRAKLQFGEWTSRQRLAAMTGQAFGVIEINDVIEDKGSSSWRERLQAWIAEHIPSQEH